MNQYLLIAMIHDNFELVSKPIKNDNNPKLTPFAAWTAGGHPEETIYQEMQIVKLGRVFGCIIKMEQENIVNFKFPLLSSNCRSKHFRLIMNYRISTNSFRRN